MQADKRENVHANPHDSAASNTVRHACALTITLLLPSEAHNAHARPPSFRRRTQNYRFNVGYMTETGNQTDVIKSENKSWSYYNKPPWSCTKRRQKFIHQRLSICNFFCGHFCWTSWHFRATEGKVGQFVPLKTPWPLRCCCCLFVVCCRAV